jgi:hypothetical protein
MNQGNATRFEEYATLRQETLELAAFTRQVLYWTVFLVVGVLGWYITQPHSFPAYGLAILLLLALFASSQIYFGYLFLIFRVGGYLAVFWESSQSERGLQWHRFSRHSSVVPGQTIHTPGEIYVYMVDVVFVVLFILGFAERKTLTWFVLLPVMFIVFLSVRKKLKELPESVLRRRIDEEKGWKKVKESPEEQKQIHRLYETL